MPGQGMVQESSRRWIEVLKRFGAGERDNLLCPVNEDCHLKWEWIPAPGTGTSEYRLYCPGCEAQNFVLKMENP
jgi:hypothetical protein